MGFKKIMAKITVAGALALSVIGGSLGLFVDQAAAWSTNRPKEPPITLSANAPATVILAIIFLNPISALLSILKTSIRNYLFILNLAAVYQSLSTFFRDSLSPPSTLCLSQ